ncbi:MAG: NUDIX domain-containing protein [Actinomycetota bacterium]
MRSAGIALLRPGPDGPRAPEVLLVHPGGPFWRNKDTHAWSIPKGEVDEPEPTSADLEATARREFAEETGHPAPDGPLVALPEFRLGSSSKRLHCFVTVGRLDPATVVSNTFDLEWPPQSGTLQSFPEVDRADWFDLAEARTKLHKGQVPLVDLLVELVVNEALVEQLSSEEATES